MLNQVFRKQVSQLLTIKRSSDAIEEVHLLAFALAMTVAIAIASASASASAIAFDFAFDFAFAFAFACSFACLFAASLLEWMEEKEGALNQSTLRHHHKKGNLLMVVSMKARQFAAFQVRFMKRLPIAKVEFLLFPKILK
jgi:hypothetical protein